MSYSTYQEIPSQAYSFANGDESQRNLDFFATEDTLSWKFAAHGTDSTLPVGARELPLFSDSSEVTISVVWQSGVLGAAVYSPESASVDLLVDIQENSSFSILENRRNNDEDDGTAVDLDQSESRKLRFLKSKEFALGIARQRIERIKLPTMPEHIVDQQDVRTYLSSIIDFTRIVMVRAFGGLLNWLDQNIPRRTENQQSMIISIRMFSLEDTVLIDPNSQRALRIFFTDAHPSAFKAGKTSKEGLSLFSLFNKCRSAIGTKMLRSWFSSPSRNPTLLHHRHKAVHFFMNGENNVLQKELEKLISGVKDVKTALGRMAKGACTLNDWAALEKTAVSAYVIGRLILKESVPQDIEIIGKICDKFTKDLARIAKVIQDVVDFETSASVERFIVKPGVVAELDDMKRKVYDLNETLTFVAAEELSNVPGDVKEVRVAYIPYMGYLLVIQENEDVAEISYELPEMDFMFKAKSAYFYKSERMRVLDEEYGDLVPKIHDMERSVMIQLQNIILRYEKLFSDVMNITAELDCLMSIATVSVSRNYVVPLMSENAGFKITEGRHPLQELCVTTFVPNSTDLGDEDGRIQILTGPNMSGKSVYLKQVAIIVFLAHVGCPVPAARARIQYVDKIFTRLLTEETVALRQSAFLIDLTQVGLAANYATASSLVILDEFGKGTRSSDGLSLLASILRYFLAGSESSMSNLIEDSDAAVVHSSAGTSGNPTTKYPPFILLATHFHALRELVPPSSIVRYLVLDHIQPEKGQLVFLYKLRTGVADSSYASVTSKAAGFSDRTLDRVRVVTESLCKNVRIEPLRKLRLAGFSIIAEEIIGELLLFDPLQNDARAFLDRALALIRHEPITENDVPAE